MIAKILQNTLGRNGNLISIGDTVMRHHTVNAGFPLPDSDGPDTTKQHVVVQIYGGEHMAYIEVEGHFGSWYATDFDKVEA